MSTPDKYLDKLFDPDRGPLYRGAPFDKDQVTPFTLMQRFVSKIQDIRTRSVEEARIKQQTEENKRRILRGEPPLLLTSPGEEAIGLRVVSPIERFVPPEIQQLMAPRKISPEKEISLPQAITKIAGLDEPLSNIETGPAKIAASTIPSIVPPLVPPVTATKKDFGNFANDVFALLKEGKINEQAADDYIEATWKQNFPNDPITPNMIKHNYKNLYKTGLDLNELNAATGKKWNLGGNGGAFSFSGFIGPDLKTYVVLPSTKNETPIAIYKYGFEAGPGSVTYYKNSNEAYDFLKGEFSVTSPTGIPTSIPTPAVPISIGEAELANELKIIEQKIDAGIISPKEPDFNLYFSPTHPDFPAYKAEVLQNVKNTYKSGLTKQELMGASGNLPWEIIPSGIAFTAKTLDDIQYNVTPSPSGKLIGVNKYEKGKFYPSEIFNSPSEVYDYLKKDLNVTPLAVPTPTPTPTQSKSSDYLFNVSNLSKGGIDKATLTQKTNQPWVISPDGKSFETTVNDGLVRIKYNPDTQVFRVIDESQGIQTINKNFKTKDQVYEYLNEIISPSITASKGNQLDASTFINNRVGAQQGSNPGGWFEVENLPKGFEARLPVGTRLYAKFQDENTKSISEHLANRIYKDFGYNAYVPKSYLFSYGPNNKQIGYASQDVGPEWKTISSVDDITEYAAQDFLKNAHIDMLLANWDVISYNWTNVLYDRVRDRLLRVDQGGSLLHKAMTGRKPTDLLEKLTEWERFPQSRGYKELLEKAGYNNFDELGFDLADQIQQLPDHWNIYVENAFPNWTDPDKDAIIKMLNARTKLLKEKVKQAPVNYFKKQIDETRLDKGDDFIQDDWPEWHQIMKSELDPHAQSYFKNKYVQDLSGKFPEFEKFRVLLNEWFGSSKEIKYTLSQILGVQTGKYTGYYSTSDPDYYKNRYFEPARTLLESIKRETETAPKIWRGKITDYSDVADITNYKIGDKIQYLPSSYSSNESTARGFTGGVMPYRVVFEILPNSKSFKGSLLSTHPEMEWISGGEYEIVGIRDEEVPGFYSGQPEKYRYFTLKQTGVFDVPKNK